MPRRTTITCKCGYRWRTRHQDLTQVACPKCKGGRKAAPPPPPPRQAPDPGKRDNGGRNYGMVEIQKYLWGIGCWHAENFKRCMEQRTKKEHAKYLRQVIIVNKTRHDSVGRMETDAALEALRRLGQ
jgi:hypothetical protein